MKSPLVDAIRQASDDSSVADESVASADSAAVDAAPDSQAEAQLPDPGDLQLMDGTEVLPIDRAGILPIDGAGILPIDGAGIPSTNEQDAESIDVEEDPPRIDVDAKFYETIKMEIANDDDAAAALHAAVPATSVSPQLLSSVSRRSRMPRIGLYSPLICLVLAAGSAGSYLAYNGLGGLNENSDLAILSSQIPASPGPAVETAPPDSVQNRFELIVGAQGNATSRQRNVATGSATVSSPVATSRTIAPRTSNAADDAAFADLEKAYAAYEQGDYDAAEASYRSALRTAPNHPGALHGLAAILHRTNRLDESLVHYESLLSVDPNSTAAAVALLSPNRGAASIANESQIKQLIQQHPQSAHLQFALGMHYAKQARWGDARHRFDLASRLDQQNADYIFNLAVSLENLGQYEDARHYYGSALAAARANSTLNSEAVVARIDKLALRASTEKQAP